jgi:branched-chain amino acid transport system substrate-binding protein
VPTLGACVEQQLSQLPPDRQGANAAQPQLAQNPQNPLQQGTITAPQPNPNPDPTLGPVVEPKPNEIDPPPNQSDGQNLAPLNEKRFAAPPAPPLNPGVPRVAILLPLSGQHSKLGQAMLNAAQLALFHFADKQFELLPQDTQGTPNGAADAAALAIGDGASLILGPLFAGSVEAIAPAARAAGIKVIAFSNDRAVAGDGVFTMGFLPSEQVQRVVTFAVQQGVRRFAVLAPDNDYGVTIADALKQTAELNGAEVTEQAFYDPYVTDFAPIIKNLADYDARRATLLAERKLLGAREDEVARQALKRLENLQTLGDVTFDALLIADGGKRLQSIAALLPYYDIDPKKIRMLGTGQWDAPGIGAEPALVGGWYAAPAARQRRDFLRQYKEIYGEYPPRLATLAYDATALAAVFAQNNPAAPDPKNPEAENQEDEKPANAFFDISEITAPQGFTGRDGIFRFLDTGVAERGLSVHQVRERDTKIISRAPKNFDGGQK